MYFPTYWARAQQGRVFCWGWSDLSQDDAQHQAQRNVARLCERLAAAKRFTKPEKGHYGYAAHPLREPVLGRLSQKSLLTRNAMGCVVLNSTELACVDVDDPAPQRKGLFGWLRSRGKPPAPPPLPVTQRVEQWLSGRPGWGLRLYRTAAGHRVVVTHEPLEPQAAEFDALCDALGADPLYRRLCRGQQSFRARLTPKHWRCDLLEQPVRWPWVNPEDEQQFAQWEAAYRQASAGYATTHLQQEYGKSGVHSELLPILEVHDGMSRATSDLPLA